MMNRTPIHVGEILAEELEGLGLSASGFARALDVPPNRITQILSGRRGVTADTALRLGQYFGSSAEFWINLQKMYELDRARVEIGDALAQVMQRSENPIQDRPQ